MSKISRYENVQIKIEEGRLVITCEIDAAKVDIQPSKSGKTLVIATTGGAARVPDTPLKVNLTVYKPR